MSVTRRRIAALLTLPMLALLIVGCSGVREQTQAWREPPDGVGATAGSIAIRNVVVVTNSEGDATLYASFANHGDDADALTGGIVGGIEASPQDGEVELPVRAVTSVSPDDARIDVSGFDVAPGRIVSVEFIFANAPRMTVQTIVKADEGYYADVTFG